MNLKGGCNSINLNILCFWVNLFNFVLNIWKYTLQIYLYVFESIMKNLFKFLGQIVNLHYKFK